MKSIKYLFLALIATVMVGCTEDTTEFEPGPVDTNTDSAALAFAADAGTYFSFDKQNDAMELDIAVYRTGDSSAAASYNVNLASGDADIFSFGTADFAAGATESTVKLSFPDAVPGTSYSITATFEADDMPIYSDNTVSYTTTIFIDYPWLLCTAEDGSTTGTWTEGLIGGIFSGITVSTKEVEIWYTEGVPGLYRIENIYTADFTSQLWGCTEEEEAGYAVDPSTLESPIYTYIDASDPDAVWIEYCDTGYFTGSTYGNFAFSSYVPENASITGYSGSTDSYGTLSNGVITFPDNAFLVTLTIYGGAWYGGSSVTILFPGAELVEEEVVEPEATEEWTNFEFVSGEYDMNAFSYYGDAWVTESIAIDYDATTGAVSISGLFYGYSAEVVAGTYDAEAKTISIPDWQYFGEYSLSSGDTGIYFANASDTSDIVFTLNSDATAFETTQYWGYYAYELGGWYAVYTESNISESAAFDGGIESLTSGAYTLSGYSYFDEAYYTEDLDIFFDEVNGLAYIKGLFYGYSSAVVVGTFDSEAGTISIPDWQYFGDFAFSSGDAGVYFANAEGEDDIVFTLTESRALECEQWWGYYVDGLGWYEVYTSAYVVSATTADEEAEEEAQSVLANYASITDILSASTTATAKSVVAPAASSSLKSTINGVSRTIAPSAADGSFNAVKVQTVSTSARQIKSNATKIK